MYTYYTLKTIVSHKNLMPLHLYKFINIIKMYNVFFVIKKNGKDKN